MDVIDDMETIIDFTTKLSYKFTQNEKYIQNEIEKYGHETLLLCLKSEHMTGKQVKEA